MDKKNEKDKIVKKQDNRAIFYTASSYIDTDKEQNKEDIHDNPENMGQMIKQSKNVSRGTFCKASGSEDIVYCTAKCLERRGNLSLILKQINVLSMELRLNTEAGMKLVINEEDRTEILRLEVVVSRAAYYLDEALAKMRETQKDLMSKKKKEEINISDRFTGA